MEIFWEIVMIILELLIIIGGCVAFIVGVLAAAEWNDSKDYWRSKKLRKYVRNLTKMTQRRQISWRKTACRNYVSSSGNARIVMTKCGTVRVDGRVVCKAEWPWNRSLTKLLEAIKKQIKIQDLDVVRHIIKRSQ